MDIKTERTNGRFHINTGRLTGVYAGCFLQATAEEDFTALHRLPG